MSFQKPKTIAIIGGTGQMGSIFSKVFRSQGYSVLIASTKTKLTPKKAVQNADVVIISVPIEKTIPVIKKLAPLIPKSSLLIDFTSIKKPIVKEMKKHSSCEVIGGHPLFGKTSNLENQNFIICPTKKNSRYVKWLTTTLVKSKLNVYKSTPKEHDQNMAIVQCLNNFNILSMGLTVNTTKKKNLSNFETLKFKIFTPLIKRLSTQNPSLYYQILTQNPYSLKTIKKFIDNSSKIYKTLSKKDEKAFRKIFKRVNYSSSSS